MLQLQPLSYTARPFYTTQGLLGIANDYVFSSRLRPELNNRAQSMMKILSKQTKSCRSEQVGDGEELCSTDSPCSPLLSVYCYNTTY